MEDHLEYDRIYPPSSSQSSFATPNFFQRRFPVTVDTTRATVGVPVHDDEEEHGGVLEEDDDQHSCGYFFLHRLILCLVAISLLWLTSLQICTLITGQYIAIPTFQTVINHCQFGYDRTVEQQQLYTDCVNRQVKVCNIELVKYNTIETTRMEKNIQYNQQMLQTFQSLDSNCTTYYTNTKAIYNTWLNGGLNYELSYDSDCVGTRKDTVASLLGDTSSSQQTIYLTSSNFALTSNARIAYMVQYSNSLSKYNQQYMTNKTKSLQQIVLHSLPGTSLPHMKEITTQLNTMDNIINTLYACIALDNITSTPCPYGRGIYQYYQIKRLSVNFRINTLSNSLLNVVSVAQAYSAKALAAMAQANSFYAAVKSVNGIIVWIINNIPGVGTSLCGKTNPDWCSFTSVSIN